MKAVGKKHMLDPDTLRDGDGTGALEMAEKYAKERGGSYSIAECPSCGAQVMLIAGKGKCPYCGREADGTAQAP